MKLSKSKIKKIEGTIISFLEYFDIDSLDYNILAIDEYISYESCNIYKIYNSFIFVAITALEDKSKLIINR